MPNILYVQPIFAPDRMRLERNKNSIISFGNYIKANGTDGIQLSIVLGGWVKDDIFWAEIVECVKNNIAKTVEPIRFDRNYGKAVVVNKLVEIANQNNTPYENILTCDSDILFLPEVKFLFGRLVTAVQNLENVKKRPFGLISLNQKGAQCHWQVCYENAFKYIINTPAGQIEENFVWPTQPSGIAGGCLFLSRKLWENVGGYRVLGLYAGDDAYMLVDCAQRGFSYQMADTLSIVHPPEDDEKYAEWKRLVCHRDSHTGIKKNLDQFIKEADAFWAANSK